MGLFLWPISESLAADKVTYNITEQLSKSQTWLGILDYKNKALEVKNQDYSTFIEVQELSSFILTLISQQNNMVVNEVSVNRRMYR